MAVVTTVDVGDVSPESNLLEASFAKTRRNRYIWIGISIVICIAIIIISFVLLLKRNHSADITDVERVRSSTDVERVRSSENTEAWSCSNLGNKWSDFPELQKRVADAGVKSWTFCVLNTADKSKNTIYDGYATVLNEIISEQKVTALVLRESLVEDFFKYDPDYPDEEAVNEVLEFINFYYRRTPKVESFDVFETLMHNDTILVNDVVLDISSREKKAKAFHYLLTETDFACDAVLQQFLQTISDVTLIFVDPNGKMEKVEQGFKDEGIGFCLFMKKDGEDYKAVAFVNKTEHIVGYFTDINFFHRVLNTMYKEDTGSSLFI